MSFFRAAFFVLSLILLPAWITAGREIAPAQAPVTLRVDEVDGGLMVPLAVSFQQVVLERRSATGWLPVAVHYPQGMTREQMRHLRFVLPVGCKTEDVRVQGYRAAKFPVRFINGRRFFMRPAVFSEEARSKPKTSIVPTSPTSEETGKKLPLGWRTDRVLPVEDSLVQVEDGHVAKLRITPANNPGLLLEQRVLGPGRVVGLTRRCDLLAVAQWLPPEAGQTALLRTWIWDLALPTAPVEVGRAEQELRGLDDWDLDLEGLQACWVDDKRLLWFIPGKHHPELWWSSPAAVQTASNVAKGIRPTTSAVAVFCSVEITGGTVAGENPQVLRVQGRVTHTSEMLRRGDFLFFSYDRINSGHGEEVGGSGFKVKVPLRPVGAEVGSWLQMVDLRSAALTGLLLRQAVSIPGQLLHVDLADAQGALLFTQTELKLRPGSDSVRVVQTAAYDGVNAYQMDNYITGTAFNSASAGQGGLLYLARSTGRTGVVTLGYQPDTGRFKQLSAWKTQSAPELLRLISGHLLASSRGSLEVATILPDTGELRGLASYDTPADLLLRVDRAEATTALDLWIPAGDYGVEFLQKQ